MLFNLTLKIAEGKLKCQNVKIRSLLIAKKTGGLELLGNGYEVIDRKSHKSAICLFGSTKEIVLHFNFRFSFLGNKNGKKKDICFYEGKIKFMENK